MKTILEIAGAIGFLWLVGVLFNHFNPWVGIGALVVGLVLIFNYLKKRR